MLLNCLKIIWYCFLGSLTTVICVYFLLIATEYVLSFLYDFLYGGVEDDTEE